MRSTLSPCRSYWVLIAAAVVLSYNCGAFAQLQPNNGPANPPAANNQRPLAAPFPGPPMNGLGPAPTFGPNFGNNNSTNGAQRGAAANADCDSLIDLIQGTVAPDTWTQNTGGGADIRPFPGGVLVDAGGLLRLKSQMNSSSDLTAKRGAAPPPQIVHPQLA